MKVINLSIYKELDLSFYLGLEKYIINKEDNDDYFFIWNINKSIIIGINQLLDSEINVNKAQELGYKIYRRPSGGGAIVADTGCFMFTFITKHKTKDEMYQEYLSLVASVIKKLGANVNLSGRNDLLFMDKKFSGNSIYYKNNKTILHGTFLFDSNLDDIESILKINDLKLASHGIESFRSRVINLKDYLSIKDKYQLIDYINNNISSDLDFVYLNSDELDIINKYKNEFEDVNFIYKKNPPFTYHNKIKVKSGIIEVYIDVKRNIVNSFKLIGDFFNIKEIEILENKFIGINYSDIIKEVKNIDVSNYIDNMTNEEFCNLLGG